MVTKNISPLEQKVMNLVWAGKVCTVWDVHLRLKRSNLAYTTVATILQRLYIKGLVERNAQSRAYVYSPKLTKESYSKRLAKNFLSRFFSSFGDVAIVSFAESVDQLSKEKRDHLLKLLKK